MKSVLTQLEENCDSEKNMTKKCEKTSSVRKLLARENLRKGKESKETEGGEGKIPGISWEGRRNEKARRRKERKR